MAWGAELGADGDVRVGRLALTGFWVEIRDPIVNVTVGAGPATIDPCGAIPDGGTCRQRQNLGATRVRGLEVGVSDVVLGPASLGAGYQLADSRVLEAEQAPSLVGKQLAQVPRHRGAITLAAGAPALARLTVTGRFEGRQYDDDLNSRVLHAYATLDAGVARVVTESLTLAVEGRNLAGPRAEVGRTASGVVSIGDPLQVWAELRATF